MKKILLPLLFILSLFSSCKKEPLKDFSYFHTVIKSEEIDKYELLRRMDMDPHSALAAILPNRKLKVVAIKYKTVDPQGNVTYASGSVFHPTVMPDFEEKGAVLAVHYTLGADYQVPSQRMACHEALFALFGFTVVAPDYIGFGTTKNLVHPYHHSQNTGRVSTDMLFAAKEYMASFNQRFPKYLTIMGYSEGGHAALSCLKYIEENYPDWLRLTQVFAGAGAYDLPATYKEFVRINYSSQPATIPMLMLGLNYGDNLNLDFNSLFLEPFRSNYKDWILSKQYTTSEITQKMNTTDISKFLNLPLLAQQENFMRSLEKNSLVKWKPRTKVTLLHGNKDTIVPFLNSENAYKSFAEQGCDVTLKVIEGKDHMETGNDFYLYCMLKMVSSTTKSGQTDVAASDVAAGQQLQHLLENSNETFFNL